MPCMRVESECSRAGVRFWMRGASCLVWVGGSRGRERVHCLESIRICQSIAGETEARQHNIE